MFSSSTRHRIPITTVGSQGGRQGLAEAQRCPGDFNGIIAGASAIDQMRMRGARIALKLLVNKNQEGVIPRSKYGMINTAVLNACDARDGVKDGLPDQRSGRICKTDARIRTSQSTMGPVIRMMPRTSHASEIWFKHLQS